VGFADEYYEQLIEVFARQGRRPPYDLELVREMIHCVEPSGSLLMLRAVAPDGTRIATALFPAREEFAYFWGGASPVSHRILRPNDAIFWHAIRHFRERGVELFDFGGGGDYKRKFGGPERQIPVMRRSRVPGLLTLRNAAAYVYKRRAMRGPAPAPTPARAATPFPRASARGLRNRAEAAAPADAAARGEEAARGERPADEAAREEGGRVERAPRG